MYMLKKVINRSKPASAGDGTITFHLSEKTTTIQMLLGNLNDKIVEFHHKIIQLFKRFNNDSNRIGNMDETEVYLNMPGEFTLQKTGSRTASIRTTRHDKDKVTVMLAALGDGTKSAPLVIFKGVRAPKNVPNRIVLAMSKNEGTMRRSQSYGCRSAGGSPYSAFLRFSVFCTTIISKYPARLAVLMAYQTTIARASPRY